MKKAIPGMAAFAILFVAFAADELAKGFANPKSIGSNVTNRAGVVTLADYPISKALPWRTDPVVAVSEAQVWGGGRTVAAVTSIENFKRDADYRYCSGVNYIVCKVPETSSATWDRDGAWARYQARCEYMLRQGRMVVDGFYFGGEKVPYPNRPYGRKTFGEGSDYLVLSKEALMASKAEKGHVVSPGGVRARFLAIPEYLDAASPEVMRKIEKLAAAGVVVVGDLPKRAFGPSNPTADEEVKRIAERLQARDNVYGNPAVAGVYRAGFIQDFLSPRLPAPQIPAFLHIHRRADDGSDIYFVAAQSDSNVTVTCRFRVTGREPELWYPATGRMELSRNWSEENTMTSVTLTLPPDGSVFVVFRPQTTAGLELPDPYKHLPEAPQRRGAVTLGARGCRPPCAITIPAGALPSVRYAAEELRDHLKKMTGVNMDIVREGRRYGAGKVRVSVGLTDDPSLGDDGFEIKTAPGSLTVRGGCRGVIYGVHELLERYGGVMWLSPDFSRIPEVDSFSVPVGVSLRETPAFAARHLDTFRNDDAFAVRCRLNEYIYPDRFGGPFPPFDPALGKCHTFLRLVPPDKYYDTHPEYYSLVKGKRMRRHAQLCLTNPDVFEIVLSNVVKHIEFNKSAQTPWRRNTRYYGVSQDDWNNYCECETCAAIDAQEESHSGCVIWFVNKIAEAVEKLHPDVMIETLAYMYGRKPPKNLKPRDNVMICLCTIECDFSKPMAVNRYKENVDFRTNVLKWRDISKHLYLWDYAANWRATPVPYPNLTAYAENIRFYHGAGVRHLFEEGISSPSASFTDLKGWLGAKLMWNPFQPAEPLVKRFCEAYYGKAAPFVLDFIKLMGEQEIDETKTPITYAVPLERMPFTKEFYEQGRALWVKAEAAVADECEAVRKHVAWGRFGLEYALAGSYAQMGDWRAVILSRSAAAKLDSAEFARMRESARYCQRMLDADPKGIVSSRLNDVRLKGYLKALAQSEFPATLPEKALIQDCVFNYNDHPKSKTISRAEDKEATDGRVITLKGELAGWSVTCPLISVLALEKGQKYRMRARLKVEPQTARKPEATLMSMGIFDRATKKTVCRVAVKGAEATGQFVWYDMGEWTDEGHECILYMDPGGANISLDCVEVSRGRD